MNLVKEVPCLHCEERHKLCHSHCEKYKAYKQKHDAIKSERSKAIEENNFVASVLCGKPRDKSKNRVYKTHKK